MGVSIWEGNKAERVAAALELIAMNGAGQASGDLNWKAVQNIVRAGLGEKAFPVGTQFRVKKETSLSTSMGVHEGITAVTVEEETFLAAEGMVGSGVHEFVFDGAAWIYNGQPVRLSDYGLTVTGTAANGDEIIVTEAFTEILFDVVDHKVTDGKPRMHRAFDAYRGRQDPARIRQFFFCVFLSAPAKVPRNAPGIRLPIGLQPAAAGTYDTNQSHQASSFRTCTRIGPHAGCSREVCSAICSISPGAICCRARSHSFVSPAYTSITPFGITDVTRNESCTVSSDCPARTKDGTV